ncbi:hypothetical protein M9H77_32505 [Catharanthus roseus]|uniref:Uncharacterized protein n=1 Tax=Catharanthus roseus TaxID=4058 RepID=A0ACC0A356_CATRO|nr:hypothetical protein M9H77_32505 [Catharanthus roseus]
MTVISLISPRGGTKRERRRMATATATTRVSAFLSLPSTPPQKSQLPLNKQLSYINKPKSLSISHARTCSGKFIHFLRLASNSSTSTVEEEEKEEEEQEQEIQSSSPDLSSVRGCQACGKEEIEKGCNGEGRIQGGIATVPGFGWWPIKAYRPCPAYLATGGRYTRRGQSMDEVASGGMRRSSSATNDSKKKAGPTNFKR